MGSLRAVATMLAGLLIFLGTSLMGQQPQAPTTDSAGVSAADVPESAPPSSGNSQVRIARLSELPQAKTAEVQLDRDTGNGFEDAVLNMPITQGTKLRTLRTNRALAEVEFEDLSTLHIVPDSEVEFTRLELLPSGVFATAVKMVRGEVYVKLQPDKGNSFALTFGPNKLLLAPSSHVRLTYGLDSAQVMVFAGEVQAVGPWGTQMARKGRTLRFDHASDRAPEIAKLTEPGAYDGWDRDQNGYHQGYGTYQNAAYSYGNNDLNNYGFYTSACGQTFWQPYLAGTQWSPFSVGYWVWYPQAGYTWVSPYPWGWLPFHSGGWQYCPNYGWGWQPGGPWLGLFNQPMAQGFGSRPPVAPRPPHPPRPPRPRPAETLTASGPAWERSIVAAHSERPSVSGWNSSGFLLRRDSAGLGVPRGMVTAGQLGHLSHEVQQSGSVVVRAERLQVGYAAYVPNGSSASSYSRAFARGAVPRSSSGEGAGARSAPSSGSVVRSAPSVGASSAPVVSSGAGASRVSSSSGSSGSSGGSRTSK